MSDNLLAVSISSLVTNSEKLFKEPPSPETAQKLLSMAVHFGQTPRFLKEAIKIFRRLASKPWHTYDTDQFAFKGFAAHVQALPNANERVHILRSVVVDVHAPPPLRETSIQGIIQYADQVTDRFLYEMAIKSALNAVDPHSSVAHRLRALPVTPLSPKADPLEPKRKHRVKVEKPTESAAIYDFLASAARQILSEPVPASNPRVLHNLSTAANTLRKLPEHRALCREIFLHIATNPFAGVKQSENAFTWLQKDRATKPARKRSVRPPDAPAGQPPPRNPAHG
ncbi:MAG: hypothetical protein WBK91_10975 [Alphaproteobacteria bacterium]